jgi:DNA-binding SARP family transcriptional activator
MDRQATPHLSHAPGSELSPDNTRVHPADGLAVYTLGRFTLIRDGQVVRHARKSPAKTLQLLKVLIASGGRQVGALNLAASMWPEKEGDLAQRAFESTLHRLRKYLGDDRYLLMEDGCLTLNSHRVWVDAWECERLLTRLRGLLSRPVDEAGIHEISDSADRVMRIYQGHFLAREQSACWSISLQERLRHRFVHGMLTLGNFWEQQGRPDRAIGCYRKGIEVDDLIETFYQHLMLCLDATGRQPEAIACYRQCRQVLSIVLGLQPAEQTQDIYRAIRARHQRQAI